MPPGGNKPPCLTVFFSEFFVSPAALPKVPEVLPVPSGKHKVTPSYCVDVVSQSNLRTNHVPS